MTHVIAADTSRVIHDSAIIKENTMKIVEHLAKQNKVLEKIAWDRVVLTQRSSETAHGKFTMMDKYFESLTEYAGSVCGDSVSEDVAEEMRFQSEDSSSSYEDDSNANLNTLEPSPFTLKDETDLMTLVIGNTHRLVIPAAGTSNKHLWTFYLLTSMPEIIEEVRVHLVSSLQSEPLTSKSFKRLLIKKTVSTSQHETFKRPHLILKSPPYKITRTGWGYFSIDVQVILKQGYLWRSLRRGNLGGGLRLEWALDFSSMGSSASYDYAVTKVSERESNQKLNVDR
jgi:hypothetical protein